MCQVLDGERASRRVRRIVRVAVLALIVCAMGFLATAGEAAASGSISSSAASERLVHGTLHASAIREETELRSHYADFKSGLNAPSLFHQQVDTVALQLVRLRPRRLCSGRQRPGLYGGRPGDAHAVCHERLQRQRPNKRGRQHRLGDRRTPLPGR